MENLPIVLSSFLSGVFVTTFFFSLSNLNKKIKQIYKKGSSAEDLPKTETK